MASKWAYVSAAKYSTVGLELVLSILFGFFGGRWLDTKFETTPWISVIGLAMGIVAGFRSLYRAHQRMQHQTAADGFQDASTDRAARFALEQKEQDKR